MLKIKKDITLQNLGTHKKRFLTHFMTLVFFIPLEKNEKSKFSKSVEKDHRH